MRFSSWCMALTAASVLAACEAAPAVSEKPAVVAVEIAGARVSQWQSASPESRLAGARAYARIAFPTARPDQLNELAERFVICIDRSVISSTPDGDLGIIAVRCERIVA